MKKVRLAIVGVGHLGAIHLKVLTELVDTVEVAYLCDIREDRTQRLARHYNTQWIRDYQELAGKVDAVIISVPTENHFEIAKYFLEHQINVFLEKPITRTIDEARALIEIHQNSRVKFQVGHVERFNSAFESIKHFTDNPLFIECHRLSPFPHRGLDVGVVMDLMIHDIDIILGIIPSQISDIQAVGVNVLTPFEDIASARISFENGCVCNLTASRISDDVMRKIRIFQHENYISLDYVKQEASIYKKNIDKIIKHRLPIEKGQPLKKEVSHFLDCILNNHAPYVSAQDGLKALKVALTISDQIKKTINQYQNLTCV